MQEWRNWQTRRLQVPVVARSCGFKSHLLHYFFALRIKNWSGGPIRIALMGSVKTFRQGILFFQKRNNSDRTFYAQYTLQKYSRKEISVIRQK